jgi:hypothetical protein
MASLNIQIIASAALHPQGRGSIEKQVGVIKQMLKKMLATRKTLNWEYLPYLVAKIINNNVSPKTGFKPSQMVFGAVSTSNSFLNLDSWTQPHYLVRNNKERISNLTTEIKEMIAVATDKYTEHKLITLEYQNKNRIEKRFRKGDYVFVLDRTTIPGNSRPLRTKFHPSPYVVIDVRHTTTRVKRIADGFESVYGNDDLKKYDKTSPLFANLPPQISRILLHDFENLLNSDLCTITKYDSLDIPLGLQLFTNEQKDIIDEDLDDPPQFDNVLGPIIENNDEEMTDEILNDPLDKSIQNFSTQNTKQANYSDIQDNVLNSLKNKIDVPKFPDNVNLNPISETTVTLNFPQQIAKSKDRPPDILDVLDPVSDEDDDIDIDHIPLDDNIQRKVTFSNDLDVQ